VIASSDKGWNSPSAAAVDIGRQEGLERIFGYILPDNYSMLHIVKKVGLP